MSAPGHADAPARPPAPAPAPGAGTMVVRGERIVYVSEGLAQLAGRPASELVGRSPLELLDAADAARAMDLRARSERGEGVPRTLELTVVLPDGGRRQVECHVEPDGGDEIIHLRDLGAKTVRRVLLEALARVGVAVRTERSEAGVHARVRTELEDLGVGCVMLRTDGATSRVEWLAAPAALREAGLAVTGHAPEGLAAPSTDFARSILADGAAFTDDWASHAAHFFPPEVAPRFRTFLHEAGFSRALGARVEGGAGGDGLYLVLLGPWRGEDVPAARLFAAQIAAALDAARLVADLRRRVAELTLLVDVARASAQLDPVLLLEAGLRRICDTVGADAAVAYLRDGDRLVLLSASGLDAEGTRALTEIPADAGPPGRALMERAPVQGRAESCGGHRPRTVRGEALGPCAAVPLLAKADAVGCILLLRVADTEFAPDEIRLLSSIGVQLGIAVDAARLFSDVRRRLADLEAVHALAVRVFANAPGDAPALLQDGCREILHALSARAVAIYLARADGVLRQAASVGVPPCLGAIEIALAEDRLSAEVIRTRAARVSEDVTRDPRSSLQGRTDVPPVAILAVPLASREDVRGVVYVADLPGRRFSPADVALANAMAGALGLGVENAGLYAEARRRVEELSLMNEAGRTIARSLDLGEVLREAVAATQRLVAAGRAFVLLHDGGRGEVRLGAGTGPVPGLEAPLAVVPGSLLARVLEERRPVCVDDLAASPDGEAHRRAHGGRSLLAVPVVLRGEPLGVLCADEEAPRRFSDSDVQRVTALADRLAVAMENAHLYLETRRRAEEVALLHEVGRSLLQNLDTEQVLETGVRNLARIVDAPDAYLSLVTEDGRSLELRAAVSRDGAPPIGTRVPLHPPGEVLATLVWAQREPIVIADAASDPRVTEAMRARTGVTAFLGLPLVARDQVIGTAVIVERRGPRRFTPAEMERASAVANQLAVAADNARLYERLRSSYAELERAQRQLLEGERLAALGELSAIVAHEVRNPLGVIFNSLGPLRRLLRPTGDARMLFNIVEEEADRLNRIVGDLLDFARPSTPELRPEDLGRVVQDAASAALGQPDGTAVDLVTELDPGLPAVEVDARLVRQAVLNVAINAVQAMPRGGRLTIRTRREGPAAVVELEDTGGGIPEEVRERIFEPFFTTKASGTGLGLAVVKRIVEGHGGRVRVGAGPGGGTVFALHFPL